MSLLKVKGLRKNFGGLRAVDGLDFDVAQGEVVGLLGPNGSGKTTAMNLISGAIPPSAGSIAFEGHVPIADMKRVLAAKPKDVRGLAVAGMPLGSPGMEAPGYPADHYNVITFGSGKTSVFARH